MSSLTTAIVPLALGGVFFAAASSRHEWQWPRERIGRGTPRGAHWARRTELKAVLLPLDVAHPGRLSLGTMPSVLKPVRVVAERAQSVVVVGPTQSGKTTSLAVPAILDWDGPVVAASVKSDLLHHTLGRRSSRGSVWCIDPAGSTSARPSYWSPLGDCGTWEGARATANDLAQSARAEGTTTDGEFWNANAAKLLSPLLFAAARDNRTMADVVRWVDTQEASEVSFILESTGVMEALDAARATWCRDDRTRSSVYTTAETILAPFTTSSSLPGSRFEPRSLLGSPNTLYLCAPSHDQRRLQGFFTALTQRVLSHAFTEATRSGKPLDPPLLVVLDEAAHIAPLAELDGLAATCASHGIQLVTIWQDLAQVRARYGARAPTVLNNHRAKLFLPGIADPETLDYASRLIGDEEAEVPSVTRDPKGARSTTSSRTSRRLLPPEDLRCLRKGDAVLIYGTCPPTKLQLRPWWAELEAGKKRN